MKTLTKALAIAALTFGAASAASAGTTTVNFQSSADKSIKKLGSYAGTASYDDVAGLLTISIQNTSTNPKAGHLTGLAFNIDGTATAAYRDGDVATTRGDEDAFDDARAKKGRVVKAKPFGMLDAGAALDGKLNSGRARRGIASGATGTFTFDVGGGAGLTAANFLTGDTGLLAAFRGKKSDKVGGTVSGLIVGNIPATGGHHSELPPTIDLPELPPVVVPPVNTGGSTGGNNGGPVAVPLPPAAWPAIATVLAVGAARLRRKA